MNTFGVGVLDDILGVYRSNSYYSRLFGASHSWLHLPQS